MESDCANTASTIGWTPFIWLFTGGILGLFAFGEWTIPVASWLAAACFIRFNHSQGPVRGFVLLSLVRMVLTAFFFSRIVPDSLFPTHIRYVAIVVGSLSATLPFLADRLVAPRLKGHFAVLFFPVVATAWEFLTFAVNPMGTFGAVGYSQYGNLPLMQLVSITGLSGLTFLISWFGSTLNWICTQSFSWPAIRSVVTTYGMTLGLVLLYGGVRLAVSDFPIGTTQIASFSKSDDGGETSAEADENDAFRQKAKRMQEQYFSETRRQADAGAELILWPEGAAICAKENESSLVERGKKVAQEKSVFLAMPLYTKDLSGDDPRENKLVIINPEGNVVVEHYKYGGNQFEGSVRGDGILQTVQTPSAIIGGVICWDLDFPHVIRQSGRNGTDILLAPANDWESVSTTHAHMAVFRAIENGVSIVRHAKNGLSIAVDPYGRTLATMDHFTASERLMITQVPNVGVNTLYSRIGDLFAWATVIALPLMTILAFQIRK